MPGYNSKLSPQLQLMLSYPGAILPKSFIQTTGIRDKNIWEVLVLYAGEISNIPEELYIDVSIIDDEYAIFVMEIGRAHV